jgi:hypothetical protein
VLYHESNFASSKPRRRSSTEAANPCGAGRDGDYPSVQTFTPVPVRDRGRFPFPLRFVSPEPHATPPRQTPAAEEARPPHPVSASPTRVAAATTACFVAQQKVKPYQAADTEAPGREGLGGRRAAGAGLGSCTGLSQRRRRHGGADGAELRADGAQGGELRRGARRHGRHPLRALDAPRVVQGSRRPRPALPRSLVSNRFSLPILLILLQQISLSVPATAARARS